MDYNENVKWKLSEAIPAGASRRVIKVADFAYDEYGEGIDGYIYVVPA